tara:strand:+ start:90 stop:572 length:483 start_codon:yes stop_codon:yes gene_type:complete
MKLEVLRFSSQKDSTNGLLFDVTDGNRKFMAYTLEDEHRDVKVMHETRIPAGTYDITLRIVGGFHAKYTQRFGDMHRGMLWVRDVPNFDYILVHAGNDDDDTSGCLLVGDTQTQNVMSDGFVGGSVNAYKRIYKPIAEAIECGDEVTITYVDFDGKGQED